VTVTLEKDATLAKILVIQGNSPVGPMLQKILEKAGHNVVLASPESVALSSSTESSPSLVITDFMAGPSDSRLETLRHVHEAAPQAKIIALFSGGDENPADRQAVAKYPGVVRVLNDPFEVGGLLDAMREATEVSS
jgi:DNA-binding NtrC family response regulator